MILTYDSEPDTASLDRESVELSAGSLQSSEISPTELFSYAYMRSKR